MNAKHILGSATLIAAAALSAAPVQAKDGVWHVGNSFVIRHADLDLETAEGRQALLDMIEKAARRACRNEPSLTERRACAAEIVERVITTEEPAVGEAVADARREREEAQDRLWAQR